MSTFSPAEGFCSMDTCNPCTCTELHPSTHSSTVWSHNQTVPAGVATPSTPVGSVVRHGPRHALHVAAPISPRFPFSGPFLWLKLWTEGRTRPSRYSALMHPSPLRLLW